MCSERIPDWSERHLQLERSAAGFGVYLLYCDVASTDIIIGYHYQNVSRPILIFSISIIHLQGVVYND